MVLERILRLIVSPGFVSARVGEPFEIQCHVETKNAPRGHIIVDADELMLSLEDQPSSKDLIGGTGKQTITWYLWPTHLTRAGSQYWVSIVAEAETLIQRAEVPVAIT